MNRFLKAFFVLIMVMFTCLRVEAAGDTPISSLKLTGNANGGTFNFTNLWIVQCSTALVNWISLGTNTPINNWSEVVVAGGGLTNGSSGVDFGSLTVAVNATNGTEVVNWQTLTNAIATLAPIPTGMPFLASNNTYSAGTIQAFALATVTNNATAGTDIVNYRSMTGYVASATSSFITNGTAGTWTNLAAYYNDADFVSNGQANVNFASLTVALNATGNTQVVNYQTMTNYVVAGFVDIPTFQSHQNNLDTDVLHLTAVEKFLATNIINWVDGSNTTVRTIGTSNIAVDINIGTNGLMFSADARIVYTTNNTIAIQYLVGSVWSNAIEALR